MAKGKSLYPPASYVAAQKAAEETLRRNKKQAQEAADRVARVSSMKNAESIISRAMRKK